MKHAIFIIALTVLFHEVTFAQNSSSVKVYFLYGSKPARDSRNTESKYFGGIHGGHVSIGIDSSVVGFGPYNGFHIFAHRKNLKAIFSSES